MIDRSPYRQFAIEEHVKHRPDMYCKDCTVITSYN
jgi:hypothetical protein